METKLQIAEIVPLSRHGGKETLTYFTARPILPGAIVEIPLRAKIAHGLVVAVEPVAELKAALRGADHQLKKIKKVLCAQLLSPQFLAAARATADYHATTLGSTLFSLLPQLVLDHCSELEALASGMSRPPLTLSDSPFKPEVQVLEDSDEERISFYKALIRQEFARGHSLFLCVPTAVDLRRTVEQLGRGIAEYTAIFHSKMGIKELRENWQRALGTPHPVLIVGTPLFLSLPRGDLKTIIIERENTNSYKALVRPFTDYRRFARMLAAELGARLIIGDIYPRTETLQEVDLKNWAAVNTLKQRLVSSARTRTIKATSGEVLSEPITALLTEAPSHNERTFLLANRRGVAPLVVCDDCGAAVLCPRCETPLVLHEARILARPIVHAGRKRERELVLLCHRCNHREEEIYQCATCNSWRLRELGTGIERVVAELEERFPQLTIFQLDSDSVTTPKAAEELIASFLASPGAILVGTEKAAHYLSEKVENIAVVATDSQFSVPDFRLHERLFVLLTRLRALATKRFEIQTRYADEPLFEHIRQGNLIDFYRAELAERERFGYPPFRSLIKITLEGPKESVRHDMAKLQTLLTDYAPLVYPSFQAIRKGKYRLNLLLKLAPSRWPESELLAVLRALPPSFIVNVEPDDIL
jgi:primosomal protein N' (replication factor Y)